MTKKKLSKNKFSKSIGKIILIIIICAGIMLFAWPLMIIFGLPLLALAMFILSAINKEKKRKLSKILLIVGICSLIAYGLCWAMLFTI